MEAKDEGSCPVAPLPSWALVCVCAPPGDFPPPFAALRLGTWPTWALTHIHQSWAWKMETSER